MQQNNELQRQDKRSINFGASSVIMSKMGVFFLVAILIIVGMFISNKFLSISNFSNIISAVALLGIVAVGVSFVTYSGQMADMSVPVIMAYSGIISVATLKYGIVVSIICGIAIGMLIGLINAFVIGKLKANPIIWTLALSYIVSGYIRWAYSGHQIYPDVEAKGNPAVDVFINLIRMDVIKGVPLVVFILVAMAIVGQFILTKTKFGQQLKLVGSSTEVAKMTGVNVGRTIGAAFLMSAFASSVGGIFLASLSKVGAYYNGAGYDFSAVTAIVIGGMTMAGGRGNIIGVIGGVFTLGLLNNLMTLFHIGNFSIDTFSQSMIRGIIFILVVGIHARSLRKMGRDDA
jgi:Ribose/xylose/arabinose/galactoside ABC-type transport systems, permease components